MGSEFDSDRLHRIRLGFRWGAARPVFSQHTARGSSQRQHKGYRESLTSTKHRTIAEIKALG